MYVYVSGERKDTMREGGEEAGKVKLQKKAERDKRLS